MNVILRKTGNSTVIIIPHQIKETFGAEIEEEIEFVTLGNNVIIRKAEPKFNFDKELEKAMNQYDELLKRIWWINEVYEQLRYYQKYNEVIWIEKDILRKAHIFQNVHYIRMEQ